MIETILLMNDDTDKAFKVNQFRKTLRHVKNVVLRRKNKERSMYELTDKEENVKPQTIVFEAFGGKTIVIVLNIFMNICKNTIKLPLRLVT